MSCSSCAKALFASSRARSFFLASILLKSSFLLTSNSARRTSKRAFRSATLSCAACTAASDLAFVISCSACSSSDRLCSSLYCCSLGSNSNTIWPFFTGVPVRSRCVIWSAPPPTCGALNIIEWLARSSPVV